MNGCGERAGAIAADQRRRLAPIQCLLPDRRGLQLDVGRRIDSSAREASPVRTSRERRQSHDISAINKTFTVPQITLRSLYCLS